VSAQPEERFPLLSEIERQRAEARARLADRPCAGSEPVDDTRCTVTYHADGQEIVADLDEVTDDELPRWVRRWRPARAYARVEDIRDMAEHGETLDGVARRLTALKGKPVSADAVERFLHRYGAHELVWQLKAAEVGEPAPDSPDWWVSVGPLPNLSPEDLEEARSRFVNGPDNAGIGMTYADSPVTASSPFARLRRGRTVQGVKL
jgi:hypothetical protein